MLSALTWELIPQTPSTLSSESRQQRPRWKSPSTNAQRPPVGVVCRFITHYNTQIYTKRAYMMFDSHIAPSCEHSAASSPGASSPPGRSSTRAQWTCVDHRLHYGNRHRQHSFDWWFIFWQPVLLTCSPELWLWIRTRPFWTAWLRKGLPLRPRTASWWSQCSNRKLEWRVTACTHQ